MSESVQNEAFHKNLNESFDEKLIALSESSLKQYLFSTDKNLKSLCEQLEVKVTEDKIVLNEDGTLSIYDHGRTIHTQASTYIQKELKSYLRSL